MSLRIYSLASALLLMFFRYIFVFQGSQTNCDWKNESEGRSCFQDKWKANIYKKFNTYFKLIVYKIYLYVCVSNCMYVNCIYVCERTRYPEAT